MGGIASLPFDIDEDGLQFVSAVLEEEDVSEWLRQRSLPQVRIWQTLGKGFYPLPVVKKPADFVETPEKPERKPNITCNPIT